MAVKHEYKVVEKTVVFSEGIPVIPFKLFTVDGDNLAFVVSSIEDDLDIEAILSVGEQERPTLWAIKTLKKEGFKKKYKKISSDLFLSTEIDEPGAGSQYPSIESGTVKFYCVFAPLSHNAEVEPSE